MCVSGLANRREDKDDAEITCDMCLYVCGDVSDTWWRICCCSNIVSTIMIRQLFLQLYIWNFRIFTYCALMLALAVWQQEVELTVFCVFFFSCLSVAGTCCLDRARERDCERSLTAASGCTRLAADKHHMPLCWLCASLNETRQNERHFSCQRCVFVAYN